MQSVAALAGGYACAVPKNQVLFQVGLDTVSLLLILSNLSMLIAQCATSKPLYWKQTQPRTFRLVVTRFVETNGDRDISQAVTSSRVLDQGFLFSAILLLRNLVYLHKPMRGLFCETPSMMSSHPIMVKRRASESFLATLSNCHAMSDARAELGMQ